MILFQRIKRDVEVVFERDPAAKSVWEVFLCYPGFHALLLHYLAHFFHRKGWVLLPRLISQVNRLVTGIEIHPGAQLGEGLFIDHGMGVVIGETTEIHENVTLYQGVTLGGTGKEKGKRHPTVKSNVVIGAGAKVLGPIEIGEHARVGAGSVVLQSIPPYTTVVGIPGRIVVQRGERVPSINLNHTDMPDPVSGMLDCLQGQIDQLRYELDESFREKDDQGVR